MTHHRKEVTYLASWSGSHSERELANKTLPAKTTRMCGSASGLHTFHKSSTSQFSPLCHLLYNAKSTLGRTTREQFASYSFTETAVSSVDAVVQSKSRFFDIPFMFAVANAIVTVHKQLANNMWTRCYVTLQELY
ncbi:hypothetical protein K0M31_006843 [Melipona bicolor]|uniref:Uncharacterized protein n=1 Tax=Melipona bicolor TaxID=60889 RepID=A0AA40FT95_9HYME|nr:hypothetical protein K0M31_006843 [Melipona bicolor]